MIFGYLLASAVALGIIWLAFGIWKIGAVSRGKPIGERGKQALLLIDLQSVFWDHGPYSDAAKHSTKDAILREIDAAKAQGHHIVAVRQEWSIPSTKAIARLAMKGQAIEGSKGTELAEPFAGLADHVLVKRVQDAFETGALDALLASLGVGQLRIAGLDLNYCVLKTALAARNRGYDVTVVEGGTLSAAPSERAERQMATHGVALR
ncbi:cysteine hydrolase family protein [Gemmobacter denitrificans]|uniref:Isochorismatase family cysteine hydrolase n=1 Tax=Gemmobacter denitrificans TaxID=3123040 RepID=A0ABU8BT85_9RHOB